jgi:hypothetical protein
MHVLPNNDMPDQTLLHGITTFHESTPKVVMVRRQVVSQENPCLENIMPSRIFCDQWLGVSEDTPSIPSHHFQVELFNVAKSHNSLEFRLPFLLPHWKLHIIELIAEYRPLGNLKQGIENAGISYATLIRAFLLTCARVCAIHPCTFLKYGPWDI